MTDIPEDIRETARQLVTTAFTYGSKDFYDDIAAALLSERRKQIERDAKIAEGVADAFRLIDDDPSRSAAVGAAAAAIRAQEPKA